jgi:hypothetical protein
MKWNIFVGSMVLSASLCGQSFGGELLHRLLGGHGVGASSSCCDTTIADPSCGAEIASGCGAGPTCGAEIAAPACDPCAGSAAPSCGVETACAPIVCRTPILDKLKGLKCKLHNAKASLHAKLAAKHAAWAAAHAPTCGVETCGPTCGAEIASGCGAGPTCGAEIAAPACGLGAPSCGAEISACDPCAAAPGCDGIRGFGLKKHGGLLSKLFKHKSGCDVACDAAPAGCSSCGSAPVAAPAMAPAPVVDPHAYLNTNRRVIQASSTRVR